MFQLETTKRLIAKFSANETVMCFNGKMASGKTTAQKFENLTVLMADIVGFTSISEKLTPEELIGKIDFYFSSFDDIMVKHKLEKIKTIGDAYRQLEGSTVRHRKVL